MGENFTKLKVVDFSKEFYIGKLKIPHRLIQAPLAGYTNKVYRGLFYKFYPPAYGVSEMLPANLVINKASNKYLARNAVEKILAYQISGNQPQIMAQAASKLEDIGADIIDINCGCPKTKIRKKNCGSAHLDDLDNLKNIITSIKNTITIPLTVKIRLHKNINNIIEVISQSGADAIIIHGRRFQDDYDVLPDYNALASLKSTIPLICNGDICDLQSLNNAAKLTNCSAYMIGRAASGAPDIYSKLLEKSAPKLDKKAIFLEHISGLASYESETQAVLKARSLYRYYFKQPLPEIFIKFTRLNHIAKFINHL